MPLKTKPKRVLFVTPHFPPGQSVGTQRIVKFIKYLRASGWAVYVLTLKKKYYPRSVINYSLYLPPDIYVLRTGKIDIFGLWDGLKNALKRWGEIPASNLRRTSNRTDSLLPAEKQNSVHKNRGLLYTIKETFTRLLQYPDNDNGWVVSIFIHSFKLIKKHRIPYVVVSSPPHSPYIALNLLKTFMDFTYVADFRDPWAHSQWSRELDEPHQKIAKKWDLALEKRTIGRANILIFNNENLKEEYFKFYGPNHIRHKSFVLSNGYDPQQVGANRDITCKKTRCQQEVVIIHTGTLYKKRNPLSIFEALKKFRQEQPHNSTRIILRFLGHVTPDLEYLDQYVRQQGLADQVSFIDNKPFEAAIEDMQNSDWLLLLQPLTTIQIPAKFFDYLTVDRPVWGVVERNSISESLIKQLNIGFVSYHDSIESIIDFFRMAVSGESITYQVNRPLLDSFRVPRIVKNFETILLRHGG